MREETLRRRVAIKHRRRFDELLAVTTAFALESVVRFAGRIALV